MKQQKDYRYFILVLILNGVGSIGNLIMFVLNLNWFRWINLGLGIVCTIALVFVQTHKEYYIRSK
jgi:hypothetical protein